MPLLEVNNVTKRFGGVVAVDGVSFAVEAGAIVGLIGANGAGKTTMFGMIAGNLSLDGGAILFDGSPLGEMGPAASARLGIGRTFQIVRPFKAMSVIENVEMALLFGRGRHRRADVASKARGILDLVELAPLADRSAGELTLAARKRLEVARALGTEPRLLLLDEVMAGLTPTEIEEACAIVRRIRSESNVTIVLVEHVMAAVMSLSERVIVLHHGKKLSEGIPAKVVADPAVIEAYLGGGMDQNAA